MPNYVTNIIKYEGDEDAIRRMLESIKDDRYGIGTIDFNKIILMPESLNIEAGSRTDKGLKAYMDFVEVYTLAGNVNMDKLGDVPAESEEVFLSVRTDIRPDEWELGRTAFQNTMRFDSPTWYEWCIRNWGTKWNAYGYEDGRDYSDSPELRFDTAWSAPHPILVRLAELYPSVRFTHEWADEDIGRNLGRREYVNGFLYDEYVPESRREAIEFACAVKDAAPEDYGLYLNAAEIDYIYLGDERYELIELFGRKALFSNARLTAGDIPKGLYCCQLCHGDDGCFCTVEPKAVVNHAGSVLTKEPLDFGKKGYIQLTEDTEPNFLGEDMTIAEFMNRDFEQNEINDMGGMTL